MLIFGQYLKQCREQLALSQRELANHLALFDPAFHNLDGTTLSRWERGINQPSLCKQSLLMRYVHANAKQIFPILNQQPFNQLAKQLFSQNFCAPTLHQQLVVKCPVDQIDHRYFKIHLINESSHRMAALNHNLLIYSNPHQRELSLEQHQNLLQLPNNVFMVCDYFDQYLGHLFLLKLKQTSYQKIADGSLQEKEIGADDIASTEETGLYYILGMFSLGTAAAHILICRLFALLIKNQQQISGLAWLTFSQEQRDWARHLGLQAQKQMAPHAQSHLYACELAPLLLNETVMKLLFKQ